MSTANFWRYVAILLHNALIMNFVKEKFKDKKLSRDTGAATKAKKQRDTKNWEQALDITVSLILEFKDRTINSTEIKRRWEEEWKKLGKSTKKDTPYLKQARNILRLIPKKN